MRRIAVFIIKGGELKGMEGETAERVSRHLLSEGNKKVLDIFEVNRENPLKIKDLCKHKDYDVFVIICGNIYITCEGVINLSRMIIERDDLSVICPVTNESKVTHQRHAPPFFYQTLTAFRWAAGEIYKQYGDNLIEVEEFDNFCLAFRKEIIYSLPENRSLVDLPEIIRSSGLRCGMAKGIYAHRYGNCYESGREDLIGHVPFDAGDVLDIGCANGLFGEALKRRQKCVVQGVEMDAGAIKVAEGRLDNGIKGDIEKLVDEGILEIYDCIVCGDLLEHLNDPWRVVRGLKKHLKRGGLFIASTPNIANWAVIYEMLKGRWDYVPFSILSGTHIRFFSRETLIELFNDSGYRVKEVHLQSFGLPLRGAEFIEGLQKNFPEIREDELKASEIVIIAGR